MAHLQCRMQQEISKNLRNYKESLQLTFSHEIETPLYLCLSNLENVLQRSQFKGSNRLNLVLYQLHQMAIYVQNVQMLRKIDQIQAEDLIKRPFSPKHVIVRVM